MAGFYEIGSDEEEELYDLEEMLGEFDDDEDDLDEVSLVGRRYGPAALLSKVRKSRRRRQRPSGRIRSRARAIAAKQVASSVLVKQSAPNKSREQALGFDSVATIAAGASSNVTSSPQVVFRPDRLVVSGAIAASFLIDDIKVGRSSQLISSDSLPAEAFSNLSVGVGMKMDTAQISQTITLSVTNTSAGALRFTAALIGPVVEM